MQTDYQPYWARIDPVHKQMEPAVFGASTALVEMPITWSLDDYPAYEMWESGGVPLLPLQAVIQNALLLLSIQWVVIVAPLKIFALCGSCS